MKIDPKFYKLMAMTTSENDNEALVAMRMANKMLKESKLTWKQVLDHAQDSGFEALRLKYNQLVEQYNGLVKSQRRGLFF